MPPLLAKGPGLLLVGFAMGILVTYGIMFRFNASSMNQYTQVLVARQTEASAPPKLPAVASILENANADFEKQVAAIQKAESSLSKYLYDSVRVLCWIMTAESRAENRQAIIETWGPRCQTLLFIMGSEQAPEEGKSEKLKDNIFMVHIRMVDLYKKLWTKTKLAFKYVAQNYKGTFDWVLKIDDDSYVVMENLRLFLSDKDQKKPEYYGAPYKASGGYNSGGPGYVLSAFNTEKLFENGDGCKNEGMYEDIEMANCLRKIGIKTADTRDRFGRFRWSPFEPLHTMFHELLPPQYKWFWGFTAYTLPKGLECCSDEFVSFHYISPTQMRLLDYLVYYLHPFSSRQELKSANNS